MTRASLLHVLDHLSEISDSEVRELEQLATAFPYCQTAHLLLAKAAHDRGSMLASQRLRRAATYATDRQLLRQLIEFTAPVAAPVALLSSEAAVPTVSELIVADASSDDTSAEAVTRELGPAILPDEPEADVAFEVTLHDATAEPLTSAVEIPVEQEEALLADTTAAFDGDHVTLAEDTSEPSDASIILHAEEITDLTMLPDTEVISSEEAVSATDIDADELELIQESTEVEQQEEQILAVDTAPTLFADELLPATAPPIRPPLEAGSSQFEFGLADTLPEITPIYELVEADAPEKEAANQTNIAASAPAFYGTDDIGYAFGAGSRMGYCLQSTDELTRVLPTGSFEPDALILAHLAAHQPAQPETPTRNSIDIISQFLRNKPRLKAPAAFVRQADEQTDLSVTSTRAEPDLASESLALIMVRQGKKDRAIEIYERLMVRQPEKMAYFADQIKKLKISE